MLLSLAPALRVNADEEYPDKTEHVFTCVDISDTQQTDNSEFTDVRDSSAYYYNAIEWGRANGIATGFPDGTFGVGETCTRRETLIFLWRMFGRMAVSDIDISSSFSDMLYGTGTATYQAASWGIVKGITKGYSDGAFKPDSPVTRKDVLIMLYRATKRPYVDGTMPFTDCQYDEGTDTYNAILWAWQEGITNGYGDGTFRPDDDCTREQILTFLFRAADKIDRNTYTGQYIVTIGDSDVNGFGVSWNDRFTYISAENLNKTEKSYAVDGTGFFYGPQTFYDQIAEAAADATLPADEVSAVVILGGWNDWYKTSYDEELACVIRTIDYAHKCFPEAAICVGFGIWDESFGDGYIDWLVSLPETINEACPYAYILPAYGKGIFGLPGTLIYDNVHMNAAGMRTWHHGLLKN